MGYLPSDCKDLPVLVRKQANKQLRDKSSYSTEYRNASKKAQDSMLALTGEKYAYIDKAQNFIVPFETYDNAEPFGLGRKAIVAKKGKYGIKYLSPSK